MKQRLSNEMNSTFQAVQCAAGKYLTSNAPKKNFHYYHQVECKRERVEKVFKESIELRIFETEPTKETKPLDILQFDERVYLKDVKKIIQAWTEKKWQEKQEEEKRRQSSVAA